MISKLKLEKLFRNAEKIDFIFDATYVMKLLNFKWNKSSSQVLHKDIWKIRKSQNKLFLKKNYSKLFKQKIGKKLLLLVKFLIGIRCF